MPDLADAAAVSTATPLQLAVIVPTVREAANIPVLLARLTRALEGLRTEIIVVDDWSDDGTAEAVEAHARQHRGIRIVRRFGRRGLSGAVIEGMLATAAPIVAVIDGDLQHDETLLPKLHAAILDGADVAIGTRYGAGGSIGAWDGRRAWISAVATRLARTTSCPELSDPMSGFFAIRRALVLAALPRLSNLGFKILLDLVLSSPRGLVVRELPFEFRTRAAGTSKLDSNALIEFVLLLLDKAFGTYVSPRLLMFGMVGAVGLVVNLAMLWLGLSLGLAFVRAQSGAVALAIVFNFWLNNELTYRDRRLRGLRWLRGLAQFAIVCGLGAIANVGVSDLLYGRQQTWWVAGTAGAVVGALWNYLASSVTTWGRRGAR